MANKKAKMTPLMEQYWSIKENHQDKVLLFRMGDFFEMFYDDARTAAPILNIALTSRNKKSGDETPMCGMPHHSVAGPIAKLLAAGKKVAICDQVEDPKEAKGIVKREVTRILSPGMVYDPETLDQNTANYICAFSESDIAFLDSSTGEAFYFLIKGEDEAYTVMALLSPVEVILSSRQSMHAGTRLSDSIHKTEFEVPAKSMDQEALPSVARLMGYSDYMSLGGEVNQYQFVERRLNQTLELSPTVVRHLELFETYRGEQKGSLFSAMNRTKTSVGARLLKDWMKFPLLDQELIEKRQDSVEAWTQKLDQLKVLRKTLFNIGDIERRLTKIRNSNCTTHDLVSLAQSLGAGLEVSRMAGVGNSSSLDIALDLKNHIESLFIEEPPVNPRAGGFVRQGYLSELDDLIRLANDSQGLLLEMESRERQATGISSLKIRYNNVFGYYIEVTNTHKDKVPDHYKRKQTLTNAERYLTQELQELEDKVLSARSKRTELEMECFNQLREKVSGFEKELLRLSHSWGELDVLSSFAWLALEQNYTRPHFNENSQLQLVESRHPVVEQEVHHKFIPNSLSFTEGECILLTGPNMAGKSTLMRQVAIVSILAQIGCFVPAKAASLPLYDKIFTRIGASDFLNEGLSTFMVEMTETAEMLKKATSNSLVLLDEVGRGTSTYDGMSLAQSILEYLVVKKRCQTLFATHYHELTVLDRQFPAIHNYHMSIADNNGELKFLHTLEPGSANKSYGVQVAELAGLPASIIKRSKKILASFELSGSKAGGAQLSLTELEQESAAEELDSEVQSLLAEIKKTSIQEMTPLEAMNKIAVWQQSLS